jgi:hypothetical protein
VILLKIFQQEESLTSKRMTLEKKKKREKRKKGKERKGGRIKSKRGETSFANTRA